MSDKDDLVGQVQSKLDEFISEQKSALESSATETKEAKAAAEEVKTNFEAFKSENAELIEKALKERDEKFDEFKSRFESIEQRVACGGPAPSGKQRKSLGQQFTESESFKALQEKGGGFAVGQRATVDIKSTIIGDPAPEESPGEGEALFPVEPDRRPGIVEVARRRLRVVETLPSIATTSNSVTFVKEVPVDEDGEGTVGEGHEKPECDFDFEEVTCPIRTIACWTKASEQVLDDVPMLQSFINTNLTHGIRRELEDQIIAGDGAGTNLSGILEAGNHTPLANPSANLLISILRAKCQIEEANHDANWVFLNPIDFCSITEDNLALLGDGAGLSFVQNGLTPRIWGLPVLVSNAIPQGTFIVLDTDATRVINRMGVRVELFRQNEDDAKRNLVMIRAELRACFIVLQPIAVVVGEVVGEIESPGDE